MAIMSLLKGSFTGSLGKVVGVQCHGRTIVKSKVFTKAPATETQKEAVRAFVKLNRLSVAFAKFFWKYLKLADKTVLKHNRITSWLRPMIAGKVFDVRMFTSVVIESPLLIMGSPTFDEGETFIQVSFTSLNWGFFKPTARLHIIAVGENGRCGPGITKEVGAGPFEVQAPMPIEGETFLIAFISQEDVYRKEVICGQVKAAGHFI